MYCYYYYYCGPDLVWASSRVCLGFVICLGFVFVLSRFWLLSRFCLLSRSRVGFVSVLSKFCLGFVSLGRPPPSHKLPITQRVALSVYIYLY